jgi:GNAT superfamily N-acetyltransferase
MAAPTVRCTPVEVRTVDPTASALCDRLGDVVVRAYRALPGHVDEPEYEKELADAAGRAGLPHTVVLAAFDDGEPVGCVTYAASTESPMAEGLVHGEAGFRMLGVDLDAQGRGAGRALVEACIARARADGRAALCLHSTAWMVGAHRLYESLGFVRDPGRDWAPVPDVPLLGYRLVLG